jgi:hypothetical protein
MRAWLEILKKRHPGVTWIPGEDTTAKGVEADDDPMTMLGRVAA